MSRPPQMSDAGHRKRRYLIHLFCTYDEGTGICHYMSRIQPWANRGSAAGEVHERLFADEYELTETINRLLPHGSDLRDVLSHVGSPEGFFYVLNLSTEEASRLGWPLPT